MSQEGHQQLAGHVARADVVIVPLFVPPADSRAISTDILDFAREFSSFRRQGGYGKAALIPDTVLPVYSDDRAIRLSRAVASRRTGPRVPVVGCR